MIMAEINIQNSYRNIKALLLANHFTTTDIEILKLKFEGCIKSPRRMSYINNVSTLVSVLEKRAALNAFTIEPLIEIATVCVNSEDFQPLITAHQELCCHWNSVKNKVDYSSSDLSAPVSEMNLSPPPAGLGSIVDSNHRLPDSVVSLVCSEIGSYSWTRLARALDLRENEISGIEEEYRRTEDRARKCLHIFESRADRRNMRSRLLNGLSKARRNDLKDRVQELFEHQN